MIPKKIHYCWLSDEPIPYKLQSYIDGWKRIMPDYKIKKWDKKAFDIHSVKWVEDAYNNRKWAFAADYIRAYALYTEGGFYLDSDVLVQHRFDKYRDSGFLSSIEYNPSCKLQLMSCIDAEKKRKSNIDYVQGLGIQAAAIASIKGHPFMQELLGYYNTHTFINPDGSFNQVPAPLIYAKLLESRGFRYEDKYQYLPDEIKIYDSSVFAGFQTCTFKSIVIHVCAGSWVEKRNKSLEWIKKNLLIRRLYNTLFGRK